MDGSLFTVRLIQMNVLHLPAFIMDHVLMGLGSFHVTAAVSLRERYVNMVGFISYLMRVTTRSGVRYEKVLRNLA